MLGRPGEPFDLGTIEPGEGPALQLTFDRPAGDVPAGIGVLIDKGRRGMLRIKLKGDPTRRGVFSFRRGSGGQIGGRRPRGGMPQNRPDGIVHRVIKDSLLGQLIFSNTTSSSFPSISFICRHRVCDDFST